MNKQRKNILESNNRQIELLKKYYLLDEENKVVDVVLCFDKTSDMLNSNIGNKKLSLFSHDTLEKINSILENIPTGFQANIVFKINDLEGYTTNDIINSLNDSLELNQYSARKYRQKKEVLSAILVLIGVILLFFMIVGKNEKWFGEGVREEIISEIIDIAAWVFVWEAVSSLFLESSEQTRFAIKIRRKINSVSICHEKENKVLAYEKSTDIFKTWEEEGNLKKLSKLSILISSISFLFLSIYSLYALYKLIFSNTLNLNVIIYPLMIIFSLFAGIEGILLFLGKQKKQLSLIFINAILIFILNLFNLIYSAINGVTNSLIFIFVIFAVNITYIFGYFFNKYIK